MGLLGTRSQGILERNTRNLDSFQRGERIFSKSWQYLLSSGRKVASQFSSLLKINSKGTACVAVSGEDLNLDRIFI